MPYKDPLKRKLYHKNYSKTYKPNPFKRKYRSMLSRVRNNYNGKVTICGEWLAYEDSFINWLKNEYRELGVDLNDFKTITSYELDKDYAMKSIYSPETCILIPHRMNSLIINRSNNVERKASGNWCVRMGNGDNTRTSYGSFKSRSEAIAFAIKCKKNIIKYWADGYIKHKRITKRAYDIILNYINNM